MRKNSNKVPKTETWSQKHGELSGKRYQKSFRKLSQIPVFAAPDDEEFFFEVEDV